VVRTLSAHSTEVFVRANRQAQVEARACALERRPAWQPLLAWGLALISACSGTLEQPSSPSSEDDFGAPAGPGAVAGPGSQPATPGEPGSIGHSTRALGRTGPRRLSNVEYDNTVRDLLGSKQTMGAAFVSEEGAGFDNVASALGMSPSQYESYFNAAESLAKELFADPARIKSVLPCSPNDEACLEPLLGEFGTRAFRRPLVASDKDGLRAVYKNARSLGLTPAQALEQALVAMLAAPQFLYRVELDQTTGAPASRPLDGYELASRLSYFLWSTLPDATLLKLASTGELTKTDTLRAQLTRMLADPRAEMLVDNFAAQWLGLRELGQHKVSSERYPAFDDALRTAMIEEAKLFFTEFLRTERPLRDFLGGSLHFVDSRLSAHYGLTVQPGQTFMRVDTPLGTRRGFLGLAAFLTVSSFSHRTSPTLRAKWVLEELLCSHVPPPPPNVVDELEGDDAANAAAAIENVRKRLELHRSAPSCAGCHASLDPIGLGLEGFDAIGKSRTKYENGDPVDTRGQLPGGKAFDGAAELSSVLVQDPRFASCVTQKLLTYALGRSLDGDDALVESTLMVSGTPTVRALIETIVLSDAFRQQLPSQP
jgi:hypothetical protein